MRGFRNGEQILVCDGCFQPIVPTKKTHGITVGGQRGFHACNVDCARKAKRKPPDNRPICEVCGMRIATGHEYLHVKCIIKHQAGS